MFYYGEYKAQKKRLLVAFFVLYIHQVGVTYVMLYHQLLNKLL